MKRIKNNSFYVFKSKNDGLYWPGEKDIKESPIFSGSDAKQICREDRGMESGFDLIEVANEKRN